MTEKPKIQYIGQFYVPGSEAQVLAPKKKKKKHVQIVHGIYNMKELDDAGIRKLIKDWMKEEK